MPELLRIGAGAGFSGDRLEPAAVLAERGRHSIPRARVPRRTHGGAGAAAQAQGSGARLRPAARAAHRAAAAAAAPARRAPDHQHGRGESDRRGRRDHRHRASANGRRSAWRSSPATTCWRRSSPASPRSRAERPLRNTGSWSRRTRYLGAAALLPALQSGADIVVTGRVRRPVAVSWRRWCTSTAGRSTTSIGWREVRRSVICSSARDSSAAATTPSPGARMCRTWRTWAFPIADVDA